MAIFLVYRKGSALGSTAVNGIDSVLVQAEDEDRALELAKGAVAGDSTGFWNSAVVMNITADVIALSDTFAKIRVIYKEYSAAGVLLKTVDRTFSGVAIDALGTALATSIGDGAAYDTDTQILLVDTAGSGDHQIDIKFYTTRDTDLKSPLTGIVASVLHQGAAGDDLSFTLCDGSFVAPTCIAAFTFKDLIDS